MLFFGQTRVQTHSLQKREGVGFAPVELDERVEHLGVGEAFGFQRFKRALEGGEHVLVALAFVRKAAGENAAAK